MLVRELTALYNNHMPIKRMPTTWEESATDTQHPDNEVARRFLDLVLTPNYSALKDHNPRTRDWNMFLEGWRAFAASQTSGVESLGRALPHAQCELSRSICDDMHRTVVQLQEENQTLRNDLVEARKRSDGPKTCIRCKDGFLLEDIIEFGSDFFPSSIDVEAGKEVLRVSIALTTDKRELRKLAPADVPCICKNCFHRVLEEVASRMIERLRMRMQMKLWGPAKGEDPARGIGAAPRQ